MAADKQSSYLLKYWLPVIIWMGFIFYFSSIPADNLPSIFPHQDIVSHLLIYAVLASLFSRALRRADPGAVFYKVILSTVIFGVIYGVTDELHQAYVPGRTVSGLDVFIDGVGSFLGVFRFR